MAFWALRLGFRLQLSLDLNSSLCRWETEAQRAGVGSFRKQAFPRSRHSPIHTGIPLPGLSSSQPGLGPFHKAWDGPSAQAPSRACCVAFGLELAFSGPWPSFVSQGRT